MKQYDYLIVGAGLFGSVFAHELTKYGKKCLVIDRRPHAGGNTYCKSENGINVHYYGAHIFHTNDKKIWDYVNSLTRFNHYRHTVMANYNGRLFNLPFNMNTFYQLWGVTNPTDAINKINEQVRHSGIVKPSNLEEQAISLVGKDVYETLIKGYSEKQWGRRATELPPFIIKRLPVRFSFCNDYFNDAYQGIPVGGYNSLTESLLNNVEVWLNVDFFKDRAELEALANKIVFTGNIDEFFDFNYGQLEYRSLRFEHKTLELSNYQGCAVMNYTDSETPFTRIIEHKHFEFGTQPHTVITHEFPLEWTSGQEPYYPINDLKNEKIHKAYAEQAALRTDVIFGGRLAEYRYYDMHQIIASALAKVKIEIAHSI